MALPEIDNLTVTLSQDGTQTPLVGESGHGKTKLARTVLRQVAAIFPDPCFSLNPRMTTGQILSEVLQVHRHPGDIAERGAKLLSLCRRALSPDLITCDDHRAGNGIGLLRDPRQGVAVLHRPRVRSDTPTWGLILYGGRSFTSRAWWLGVFPGLAIMLVVLSINVIGDALAMRETDL